MKHRTSFRLIPVLAAAFGLLLQLPGYAQLRLGDQFTSQPVEANCRVLHESREGQYAEQDVLNGRHDAGFRAFDPALLDGNASSNWLELHIENDGATAQHLFLGTSRFEYINCWIKTDSTFAGPYRSGLRVPTEQKAVAIPGLSFFEFDFPARKTTRLLLKCVNRNAPVMPQQVIPLTLMNKMTYSNYYEKPADYTYMFIGATAIMAIFNLLIFFITGVRAYLLYTVYVVFLSLFVLALVPQFAMSIYGKLDLNTFPISTIGALGQIFYVLVGRNILETKKYYPRIDKMLLVTTGALVLSTCFSFMPQLDMVAALINYPATLINYPTLIALGVVMTFRKHLPGTYFFTASVFYCSGVLVMIFQLLGILPPVLFGFLTAPTALEIGAAVELALFSLGLGARINQMRRRLAQEALERERLKREQEEERKRALEEQNRILEEKVKERTKELQAERDKSEELLLNILPAEIAAELKQMGKATPKGYEAITIAFVDFVGFTKVTEHLTPEDLVATVDYYFSNFDNIAVKYDLEKIKTIGDAYFMVSGLPVENANHALDMMQACQEIMAFIAHERQVRQPLGLPWFDCRIGIHSGSVIAGIVGHKKYAFDVWGRDVNIASRVESGGFDGKINVSKATYELIKDRFPLSHQGTIDAKNIGALDLYCLQ
ncbi:MAG: hypothetical protein IPM81_08440 [Saprospirales bacterium]|nr:hypothetical protein [Saprospirales bacterium]